LRCAVEKMQYCPHDGMNYLSLMPIKAWVMRLICQALSTLFLLHHTAPFAGEPLTPAMRHTDGETMDSMDPPRMEVN